VYHKRSIIYIAQTFIHWLWQKILVLVPLLSAGAESTDPPGWWRDFFSASTWRSGLDGNHRPYDWLVDIALEGCWRMLEVWTGEVGDYARTKAQDWTRALVGYAERGFDTIQRWLHDADTRLGTWLPWFANSAVHGLDWLCKKLPASIQSGWRTWEELWESIKQSVRDWALARYDEIRTWWYSTRSWIEDWLQRVATWYSAVHAFVDDWIGNWRTRILDWLGSEYRRLLEFCRGPLDFWYNLWSWYGSWLGTFLADPIRYLYDHAENWILEHIW
jgi:hypothetical protein